MTSHLRNEFSLILVGNIILVGLVASGVQGLPNPLAFLRLILGLVYVLYIPGYLLQSLLFPANLELDNIERTALSFALSGVIVPPVALLLNWLPWGIHLWPIVISLTAFILLCMVGIVIQQIRLPGDERSRTGGKLAIRTWWAGLERQYRMVYIILASILVIASITALSILVMPKPAEFFTEFYMLGPGALAENYPRQAGLADTISVTLGVDNHERANAAYRLEIWQVDPLDQLHRQLVASSPALSLQVGQSQQWLQSWQPA